MKTLANFFKQKASQTRWPCQSIRCYTFTYCVHHTLNTKNNLFQSQQSKTLSPKNPVRQAKVQTRRSKPKVGQIMFQSSHQSQETFQTKKKMKNSKE
jgi:hypothetical protein